MTGVALNNAPEDNEDGGLKNPAVNPKKDPILVDEEMLPSTVTMTDSITNTSNNSKSEGKNRNKRHGARNQNRHKLFVKWIMDTFPCVSESSINQSANRDSHNHQQHQEQNPALHILDVAGGKGEVAARLTMCHQMKVVMVDPRPANVAHCYETLVLPKLPNKWQQRLDAKRALNPDFVQETIDARFSQLVTTFDGPWSHDTTNANHAALQDAIKNSTLLLGLHADGATESIVDAALHYRKPFVVVPCCVFPNFFTQRFLLDKMTGTQVPVRSHEQFCLYLAQKDPRFVIETLPFEGRNVAIWWNGT